MCGRLFAGNDLADTTSDVGLGYEPLRERHIDLAVGPALSDVVDEYAGILQQPPLQLLIAFLVGTNCSDVRSRRDPVGHDDGIAGGQKTAKSVASMLGGVVSAIAQ